MKRYALPLVILAVGLFWVSVGAWLWGGQSLLESSKPAPEPSPTATPDSTEKDAQVREIVFGHEAMKAMLAGREEGRDYWIIISYVYEYREAANTGEKPIAMVDFFFDPPLSGAGEIPVIVFDPCSGHYGEDERLDPADPCMNEPKEYGTKYREFTDVQQVVATVDLRRGELVDVWPVPFPIAQTTIDDIKRSYGPTEKDAQVREIVFGHEAMKAMLAEREEGSDYWIQIGYTYEYREAANTGEKPLAMVDMYFDPALSYAGEIPDMSNPCSGHYGEDERLDPADPCMNEPKEYGSKYLDLTGAEHIVAEVDLRRGELVDVFPISIPVSQSTIDAVKRSYEP